MPEIRMINQSLMRGGSKFVLFYSYNPPQSVNSWVNTEAQMTKPSRIVHHSNYTQVNPQWLGDEFIREAEYLKQSNPRLYEHEYLGEVTGTGGEVFTNVKCRSITKEEIDSFTSENRGLDFGFAVDPVAYNTCFYDRKRSKLYIYYEIDKVELSNAKLHQLIIKENPNNDYIYADSAEPKSISELYQYGLKIYGVKKGPDSVEYGVKFLQDLNEIIIDDEKCPNTAREFLNYELAKDANGNFKAKFPDKDNHHIDAVRYALNNEIMNRREEKKIEQPKKTNFLFQDFTQEQEGGMQEW